MKKRYYSWNQLEGAVLELARQVNSSNWTPDYIVGINRGGLVPANMLSQYMGIKMSVLHVSLRDHYQTESNAWMACDALGITDDPLASVGLAKNILIVDDMNDSGATLKWIKNDWQQLCLPHDIRWSNEVWNHNVKFATVFNNLASDVEVDFTVEEMDKRKEDVWIVFPWEDFWKKQ